MNPLNQPVASMFELQNIAAVTALNTMLRKSYLDVCTVDHVVTMLKCTKDHEAYNLLRALHCVHWEDMPAELRAQIPELIGRCIQCYPPIRVHMPTPPEPTPVTPAHPATPAAHPTPRPTPGSVPALPARTRILRLIFKGKA